MAAGATRVNPNRFRANQIPFYCILVPVCIFMGLPIVFIVCHAFKPVNELFAFPPRFFVSRPSFENFESLFNLTVNSVVPFSRYLFNTLIVSVFVMLISIFVCTAAGFALSKMKFKLKKTIFEVNNLALMFVATAVTIPRYLVVTGIGLKNNYLAHILPIAAIPVGLFLVKQFIDQVPDELLEAAQVEGARPLTIYRKIVVPLIRPAICTCAILTFQSAWGNMETSNLYITDDSLRTLAFYMNTISVGTVRGQGMAAAASLIMFLPNLILFIILQSNVMNTMARSGLK